MAVSLILLALQLLAIIVWWSGKPTNTCVFLSTPFWGRVYKWKFCLFVCLSSLLILFLQTLSSRNIPQSTLITQPLPRLTSGVELCVNLTFFYFSTQNRLWQCHIRADQPHSKEHRGSLLSEVGRLFIQRNVILYQNRLWQCHIRADHVHPWQHPVHPRQLGQHWFRVS